MSRLADTWPLGRPAALLLALALAALLWLGVGGNEEPGDPLEVWVFAPTHADTFRGRGEPGVVPLTEQFERETNRPVVVRLLPARAIDTRLTTLALQDAPPEAWPDLVELEINGSAKHFAHGAARTPLLPLSQPAGPPPRSGGGPVDTEAADLAARFTPQALAAWSVDGTLLAVPQDVHPVTLTYRRDLFAAAGLDPSACRTWAALAEVLRRYRAFHDKPALELHGAAAGHLALLLLQRGVSLTDPEVLDDPRVADTIDFYTALLNAGLATDASAGPVGWVNDLADGELAMVFTPDWRIAYLDKRPDLVGKLAMMPLPRFESGDDRTSVWGGTALAIPRGAAEPALSWRLLTHLSFGDAALAARRRYTHILPAESASWSSPIWDEPHPLYAGQPIGRLYATLAAEVPARRVTPQTPRVSAALVARLLDARE